MLKFKPTHTNTNTHTNRRRILLSVPAIVFAPVILPYKSRADELPKDIQLLQQAVVIDNLIAEYIKLENLDINVRPHKYIAALLDAYDCLVDEIQDPTIKPALQQHLSRIANPFKSCAKNNCA